MPIFRYKTLLALLIAVICSLLLLGCTSQFNPEGWSGPTVSNNVLYAVDRHDGRFLAVDLSKLQNPPVDLTPRLPESSNFLSCSGPSAKLVAYGTPAISNGIAYVGAYNGKVYAIDTSSRTEKWRTPVDTKGTIITDPVVAGTTLIVASGNKLFALNIVDGSPVWSQPFKASGKIWSNPVVYQNRVYFGTLGHKLYAVDLSTGKLYKQRGFNAAIASTPLIVENTLYVGTFESKFYALDGDTLESKWAKPFQANDWFWTRAAYDNGTIYVGSLDHHMYAIDAATGNAKWMSPVLMAGPARSASVVVGDVLVVASKGNDGFVYGLDLATGQEKWQPLDLGKIYSDPWVEGTTVYYLNRNDDLYALNAEQGTTIWSLSLRQK